jgi:hypothetical protein
METTSATLFASSRVFLMKRARDETPDQPPDVEPVLIQRARDETPHTVLDRPPDFEPVQLAQTTPHPLDPRIQFTEADHKYFVQFETDGPFVHEGLTSVSTFIHEFFPHFDAELVITKMRRGRNWAHSPYVGMTTAAIKQQWDDNGRTASARGTLLHFLLECHNNGYALDTSPYASILEVQDYFRWRTQHFAGLEPFRTELRMFTGSDLRLTGTADLLAIAQNHPPPQECDGVLSLHLIDWKFSKAIRLTNPYEQGYGVCQDLPSCNYSSYVLQQNLYQWMLETYYPTWTWKNHQYTSVRVISKHLAIFHTNHPRDGYYLPLPDWPDTVQRMLQTRRTSVADTRTKDHVDTE